MVKKKKTVTIYLAIRNSRRKLGGGREASRWPGCRRGRRARNARSARRRSLLSTLARNCAPVDARKRALAPRLSLCLGSFYLFGFSPVTTRGEAARFPPPRRFHRRVSPCVCDRQRRVAARSRNPAAAGRDATADKDASHRLYATAPFARMRFFHRLAPSI